MKYRVAWKSRACPFWQWKSSTLGSFDTASRYLRRYTAFPQDRLKLLRGASRAELDQLLARENAAIARAARVGTDTADIADAAGTEDSRGGEAGWMSSAVTPDGMHAYTCGEALATAAVSAPAKPRTVAPLAALSGDTSLEGQRVRLEAGAGGDYDTPYTFASPVSVKEMLAWARLLAQVRRGELES